MAHAAAVLVARATAATSAAAVQRAVVPVAVVVTIDGLSTRSYPARDGGVVQALDGVPAGATEADLAVAGAGRTGTYQREHGGGSQRCHPLKNPTPRRVTRESTDGGVEPLIIHDVPPFVPSPAP